jgi:nitrogen PTS system EIIA component
MRIHELIDSDAVLAGLRPASKKAALRLLAEKAAARWGFCAGDILSAIEAREKQQSTGFGGGVAIPHAKLPFKGRAFALFAILDSGIEFGALDGEPVDIICLLIAPESPPTEHLRALATLSRLLRDRALMAKLRGCGTGDAAFVLLDQWDSKQAA